MRLKKITRAKKPRRADRFTLAVLAKRFAHVKNVQGFTLGGRRDCDRRSRHLCRRRRDAQCGAEHRRAHQQRRRQSVDASDASR